MTGVVGRHVRSRLEFVRPSAMRSGASGRSVQSLSSLYMTQWTNCASNVLAAIQRLPKQATRRPTSARHLVVNSLLFNHPRSETFLWTSSSSLFASSSISSLSTSLVTTYKIYGSSVSNGAKYSTLLHTSGLLFTPPRRLLGSLRP